MSRLVTEKMEQGKAKPSVIKRTTEQLEEL